MGRLELLSIIAPSLQKAQLPCDPLPHLAQISRISAETCRDSLLRKESTLIENGSQ